MQTVFLTVFNLASIVQKKKKNSEQHFQSYVRLFKNSLHNEKLDFNIRWKNSNIKILI